MAKDTYRMAVKITRRAYALTARYTSETGYLLTGKLGYEMARTWMYRAMDWLGRNGFYGELSVLEDKWDH